MNVLINFFASIYDLVYDYFEFLFLSIKKLALKLKKVEPLNLLINFFAFQYDIVFNFFVFLIDYIKWITGTGSKKSPVYVKSIK